MADAKWKQFERDTAAMIHGKRYPANSGDAVDCEGPVFVAQCKLVQRMSLEDLTTLAEAADVHGMKRGKIGLVVAKVKRGQGIASAPLVVMTTDMFNRMLGWSVGPRGLLDRPKAAPEMVGVTCGCGRTPVHSTAEHYHPGPIERWS